MKILLTLYRSFFIKLLILVKSGSKAIEISTTYVHSSPLITAMKCEAFVWYIESYICFSKNKSSLQTPLYNAKSSEMSLIMSFL